jgi:hypothetical protein
MTFGDQTNHFVYLLKKTEVSHEFEVREISGILNDRMS